MEPVLINHYRFDADTLRASYRQVTRPVLIFQLLMAAVMLAVAIRCTLVLRELFAENTPLLLMVLFLYLLAGFEAWRALSSVNRNVKRTLKRMQQTKGVTSYDVTLRFGEEEIVTESSLGTEPQHTAYSGFRKLSRGKELILLRLRSGLVYTLDPKRFENGSEADFWKLMNEKCPEAVPKKLRTPAAGGA